MMGDHLHPDLERVLRSAAALQRVVPDAVLVGASAVAYHAGHRVSFDDDHVIADLVERCDPVLEAVEATEGWATSVRASAPPFTLLGRLGGVEAGLRRLRRAVPLETVRIVLPGGDEITAPTIDEALRVKAYLLVTRNQVRDYLDVAALADRMGLSHAVEVLAGIDDFYPDRGDDEESVATALAERLAAPAPRDRRVIDQLATYKGLAARWHRWEDVTAVCTRLAEGLLGDPPLPQED